MTSTTVNFFEHSNIDSLPLKLTVSTHECVLILASLCIVATFAACPIHMHLFWNDLKQLFWPWFHWFSILALEKHWRDLISTSALENKCFLWCSRSIILCLERNIRTLADVTQRRVKMVWKYRQYIWIHSCMWSNLGLFCGVLYSRFQCPWPAMEPSLCWTLQTLQLAGAWNNLRPCILLREQLSSSDRLQFASGLATRRR